MGSLLEKLKKREEATRKRELDQNARERNLHDREHKILLLEKEGVRLELKTGAIETKLEKLNETEIDFYKRQEQFKNEKKEFEQRVASMKEEFT